MPMKQFQSDVQDLGHTIGSVPTLCERYCASIEAVCARMVQTNIRCCAMALIEHQLKPVEERRREVDRVQLRLIELEDTDYEAIKKMRVTYTRPSDSFRRDGGFIPPDKSVAEDSCVYSAAVSGNLEIAEEDLELGGRVRTYRVEALPVPSRDPLGILSPVFALFYPV